MVPGEEGSGPAPPSPRDPANPADGAPTAGKVEPALVLLRKHLLQSEQLRSCSGPEPKPAHRLHSITLYAGVVLSELFTKAMNTASSGNSQETF